MKCPNCGASNASDAKWCSLCLTRFGEASEAEDENVKAGEPRSEQPEEILLPAMQPEPHPEAEPVWQKIAGQAASSREESADESAGERASKVLKREGELFWICSSCEHENVFAAPVCEVCGTSFFQGFMEPKPEQVAKDPRMGALLSVLPGVGHLYLGASGEGIMRLLLGLWWLAGAFLTPSSPGALLVVKVFHALAFGGLVGFTALDAKRLAETGGPGMLTPRVLLYACIALLVVTVVAATIATTSVRG